MKRIQFLIIILLLTTAYLFTDQGEVSLKKFGKTDSPNRTVYGYHPYWVTSSCVDNYRWELLTHIACFSVEATSTGTFSNKHSWPSGSLWQKIITNAHNNNVKVTLVCTLFDSAALRTLLSSSTYRNRLIQNLLTEVQNGNADGVNIDFEEVPGDQQTNLTTFMTDLNNTFKNARADYHVTLCGPSVDWRNAFHYENLMKNTDGIMIMCYGYYYSGSSTAGPVSLLQKGDSWSTYNVKWTINDYLYYGKNQNDKMILGIPYYGIDWPTNTDAAHSSTRGTGTSVTYKNAVVNANTYGRKWQEDIKNPWYSYSSSGYHQCWYDDDESLGYKYDEVIANNLQGIGIWALGYDDGRSELWDKIEEYFSQLTGFTTSKKRLPNYTGLLKAFPNPVLDELCFQFSADKSGNYKLLLYDINGRLIETFVDKNISKGTYHGKVNISGIRGIKKGVYYLRLQGISNDCIKLVYLGR